MALTVKRGKNPNLSYPAGIAFELGLFRMLDCRTCGEHQPSFGRHGCVGCHRPFDDLDAEAQRDGRELLRAADKYAGLHRQVWGHLTEDIERALADNYGSAANGLLLEVGRVNAPAPPASFFRKLVAGGGERPSETDPEEYRRQRLRLADRYSAARAVLQRDLLGLNIVEAVVIEGARPSFLYADRTCTVRGQEDRDALVAGLNALAEHFGLFDPPPKGSGDQRQRPTDSAVVQALTELV